MKHRLLPILLCLSLLVTLAAGCGSSTGSNGSTDTNTAAPASASPDSQSAETGVEKATSGSLVVYSALEDDQIVAYLESFQAQYPDIDLEVERISTSTLISKVIAERENPVADVIWGVAASSLLDLANYDNMIQPYTPEGADRILDQFKDTEEELRWCGIDVFEATILVNTKLCQEYGLDVPETWEDLLDPQYKGYIVMPDPTASGTGLLMVNGWLQMFDDGWGYIEALNENIAEYTSSGSKPAKMAAAGETAIGLSFGYRCILQHEENPDETAVVFPPEGAGWDVEANCLLYKEEINPCAYTFLDWAISDEAMAAYEKEMPIIAIGTDGTIPDGYNQDPSLNLYADLDLYQAAADRQSILDRFTNEILANRAAS